MDTRETAVVLSAAILWFDETKKYSYEDLVENTLLVKFDVKEQIQKYKRTVSKDTMDWWNTKVPKLTRDISFKPSDSDLSAKEGIDVLKSYIKDKTNNSESVVFIRGSFDQYISDHLCKYSLKEEPLFRYSSWRDFRTAIDILKETSRGGYCKIPGFDFENLVWKHNPKHDVASDVYMLLYGE
nr:MAG: hypothetical protein [Caudoviricetes sp.]